MLKKLGEPLGLIPFTNLFEKQLYFFLIECKSVEVSNPKVQAIVEKERERAIVEWYDFTRIHAREPDEDFCMECLERFKKEQLPLIKQQSFNPSEGYFVDICLENVVNHTLMVRERFSEDDYQFILSSERYYAEKYYKEHAALEVGYEELDIRTSRKAKLKGWHDLMQAFEQRFHLLYKSYVKGD